MNSGWRGGGVRGTAVVLVALLAGLAAATGAGGQTPPESPVGQGPPEGAPELAGPTPGGMTLQWNTDLATRRNGPAPVAGPGRVCGSRRYTYLAELLEHSANEATVRRHWGDIVPGGKQVLVAGSVQSSTFGTGDLPFDHPFGSDFNMDVAVDPEYADFTQERGHPSALPMHVELEEGLFPHTRTVGGPVGGDWRDLSERARQNVQADFFPLPGDRVIVMGRWILDCGHDNYFTELHPMTFMAWSHVDGDTTEVNFFYNPYRVMQLYHPSAALGPRVNDPTRATNRFTGDAIEFLVGSVLRLMDLGAAPHCCTPRLDARGLVGANRTSPAPFVVCAPEGTSGSELQLHYDVVMRRGVRLSAHTNATTGCAAVSLQLGTSHTPPPVQRTCVLPWDYLNQAAGEEGGTGPIDIRAELKGYVLDAYDYRVDRNPTQSCYEPLAGPVPAVDPTGQRVRRVNTFHPFYGRVEVSWAP